MAKPSFLQWSLFERIIICLNLAFLGFAIWSAYKSLVWRLSSWQDLVTEARIAAAFLAGFLAVSLMLWCVLAGLFGLSWRERLQKLSLFGALCTFELVYMFLWIIDNQYVLIGRNIRVGDILDDIASGISHLSSSSEIFALVAVAMPVIFVLNCLAVWSVFRHRAHLGPSREELKALENL